MQVLLLLLLGVLSGTLPLAHKSSHGTEASGVRERSEKSIININVIVFTAITPADRYLFNREKFKARGTSRRAV